MRGRAQPVLAGLAVCLCLAGTIPAASAPAWRDSTAQIPPLRSADDLEAAITVLHDTAWSAPGPDTAADARTITQVSGQPATDVRGRTLQQDIREQYLTAVNSARLDALLSSARAQTAAHQDGALAETLAQGGARVVAEVHRGDLIANYWRYQGDFATQQQLLDDLQARLPPEGRGASPPELRAALMAASSQLEAALGASGSVMTQQAEEETLRTDLQAALAAYTQVRTRLAGTVSASERLKGIAPLSLERSTPCPPPAPRTSAKETPGFDPAVHVALADYYPPAMRRVNVEGAVVVAATISATGCPLKAQVESGSGAPMLDAAALHYALDVRFLPAEHEQQPVEATARFRVRFELAD